MTTVFLSWLDYLSLYIYTLYSTTFTSSESRRCHMELIWSSMCVFPSLEIKYHLFCRLKDFATTTYSQNLTSETSEHLRASNYWGATYSGPHGVLVGHILIIFQKKQYNLVAPTAHQVYWLSINIWGAWWALSGERLFPLWASCSKTKTNILRLSRCCRWKGFVKNRPFLYQPLFHNLHFLNK